MRIKAVRTVILCVLVIWSTTASSGDNRLTAGPSEGEAYIWYLGHAGWLVRTSQHCLIFDAVGSFDEPGDLGRGLLAPGLFEGLPVVLFVSHAHGDHLDPKALELLDSAKSRAIVLGWAPANQGEAIVPAGGVWTEVSGARVFALHHRFDGIPEGFFLVRSGGITMYHSGDHGTVADPPTPEFRANIDRMAAAGEAIDIAFISSFGARGSDKTLNAGDAYTIRTLKPRLTLPMHRGWREERYKAFVQEALSLGLPSSFGAADDPGWFFHYRGTGRESQGDH